MFQPDYHATLALFDQEEATIKRVLPDLKQRLPSREYQRIARKFAKSLEQIAVRRRFIAMLIGGDNG